MEKISLKVLTIFFFLPALLITFSKDSKGSGSLINSSKALGPGRKTYVVTCSDGDQIIVCGVGSSTCIPTGQCGPHE